MGFDAFIIPVRDNSLNLFSQTLLPLERDNELFRKLQGLQHWTIEQVKPGTKHISCFGDKGFSKYERDAYSGPNDDDGELLIYKVADALTLYRDFLPANLPAIAYLQALHTMDKNYLFTIFWH
jgi:hypothetical protein